MLRQRDEAQQRTGDGNTGDPAGRARVAAGTDPVIDGGRASGRAPTTGSLAGMRAAITAGQHAGLGNNSLHVDAVHFGIVAGSWGRLASHIAPTVTNISDKTVSSVRAEAMLFIDGHDAPSVLAKDLFVYLGQQGLPASEARTVKASMDRELDWNASGILNARQHVLAVRLASTADGMSRPFGGSAPPPPWKVTASKQEAADDQVQDVEHAWTDR